MKSSEVGAKRLLGEGLCLEAEAGWGETACVWARRESLRLCGQLPGGGMGLWGTRVTKGTGCRAERGEIIGTVGQRGSDPAPSPPTKAVPASKCGARVVTAFGTSSRPEPPFVLPSGAAFPPASPGPGQRGGKEETWERDAEHRARRWGWLLAERRERASPSRLPSARQRGSRRLGNTMQGFFRSTLSGFVLQLWSFEC